jgi:hypothetical protein
MTYANSWQAVRFIDRALNETSVFQRLVGAVADELAPKTTSSFEMIDSPFGRGLAAMGMPSLRLFGPIAGALALMPSKPANLPTGFYDRFKFLLKSTLKTQFLEPILLPLSLSLHSPHR